MEFDVVFRSYLGIPRRDEVEACPLKCRSMLDPQGIHAEICNGAQGASMIHNAGLKVYKETQYLLNDSGTCGFIFNCGTIWKWDACGA